MPILCWYITFFISLYIFLYKYYLYTFFLIVNVRLDLFDQIYSYIKTNFVRQVVNFDLKKNNIIIRLVNNLLIISFLGLKTLNKFIYSACLGYYSTLYQKFVKKNVY